MAAKMIMAAVTTSPKARGVSAVKSVLIDGEEKEKLAKAMDLGIALGVAAKTTGELDIDNRLMYSAGAAAMNLGFLEADMVTALPLSVSEKNFFSTAPERRLGFKGARVQEGE